MHPVNRGNRFPSSLPFRSATECLSEQDGDSWYFMICSFTTKIANRLEFTFAAKDRQQFRLMVSRKYRPKILPFYLLQPVKCLTDFDPTRPTGKDKFKFSRPQIHRLVGP